MHRYVDPARIQWAKALRSLPVYVLGPPALIGLFGLLVHSAAGAPEAMLEPGVAIALRFYALMGFFAWVCRQFLRFLWYRFRFRRF